jgi:hypothetical protein
MSNALKSRLAAERLFTVDDMVIAYAQGALDALKSREDPEAFEGQVLARVQTHLSSDTTTIRPR